MERKDSVGVVIAGASLLAAVLAAVGGCHHGSHCPGAPAPGAVTVAQVSRAPCVGVGDPYASGPLRVREVEVEARENDSPRSLLIFAPEAPASYPVVVFQHGFLGRNRDYTEILRHLAGHGFVVVAPQMYDSWLPPVFGDPTAAEEAQSAAEVLDWLPIGLPAVLGYAPDTGRLGLAGHSRGGQVIWLVLKADPSRALAVVGVDPVDGAEAQSNRTWAIEGPSSFSMPALVIGTGLGGRCAPDGQNHEQFYQASRPPAWHVVVPHAGHGDMLDEAPARLLRLMCDGGPDRAKMRRLTAGLLVAFFQGSLQGNETAYRYLSDPTSAPLEIKVERR